jgi:hypothetical protein
MRFGGLLIFLALTTAAAAQEAPTIEITPYHFFGFCNETAIEQNSVYSWGECAGNFLSPAIPNPLNVFEPVTGDKFFRNIDAIKTELLQLDVLKGFINTLILMVYILIGLLVNVILYFVTFFIRFIFVYLFYISLGLQSILLYVDRNSDGMDGDTKIKASIGFMIVATLFILWYGGGWMQWS